MRRKTREKLAWSLAGLLAVVSTLLGVGYFPKSQTVPRALRATINPPTDHALIPFDLAGLSLSPDGKTLAFVSTAVDGRKQIWLRSLAQMSARPVAETEGAAYPFWSPDGQNLAFFSDAKLKVIDLRGGSPRVLADAPSGRGGSWSPDGTILFAPNITSPIHRVPAEGGKAEPVTTYDEKTETTHRWPTFLPDGKHFLYISRAHAAGSREVGRLMLASLDSPKAAVLIPDATNALYVEPGYLLYSRSAGLYAWRFDKKANRLEGQAIPIVSDKLAFWEPKNFIPMAASDDGTLVYLPESIRTTEMRWYDRQGRPLGAIGSPGLYRTPRIAPDGKKIAYMQADSAQSPQDIWIRDLEFDRASRLTQQSGDYSGPAWAPDSDHLAFACQPKGVQDICETSLSGGGVTRILFESNTWKTAGSWLPGGKGLLFDLQDPASNQDILLLPEGEGAKPTVVLRTPFDEQTPQASRDGRRVAYTSSQTGREEVYVRNLDGSPGQWQISTEGGQLPRWRADGQELIYAAADGMVMAVPFPAGPGARPGSPVRLFQMPERPDYTNPILADVTPDGQRILLNVPTTGRASIGFHVIFNWTALLPHDAR